MSTTTLDSKVKVIQITTEDRKNALKRYPSLRQDIAVYTRDEIEDLDIKLKNGDNYEGRVFVKHPFAPNTFIDASTSELEIIRERLMKYGKIAQELGAYQYTYKIKSRECSSRDTSFMAKLSVGAIRAKGKFKKQCSEELNNAISHFEQYKGVVPSEAKKNAQKLAKEYGLDEDDDTRHLIQTATSENRGEIIETIIHATKGLESTMEAAFSLKSMEKPFNIDANIIENIRFKKELTVELKISFSKNYPIRK